MSDQESEPPVETESREQDPRDKGKPHIVVLGAGFGGLTFARKFKGPARVTVIDKENHHLFQPLLYQVATAALAAPEIAEPIRHVLRRKRDVEVVMDEVTKIDLENHVVHCTLEDYRFDVLIIALGGKTSYFGNESWEEHAPGLKSLGDGFRVRKQMLTAFERAETEDNPDAQRRLMRTVVVGGGPTGVELAGAMADLTRRIFRRDFRYIEPSHAEVILIDGGERLLKAFPEELSAKALAQLQRMGVKVHLKTRVTNIQDDLITVRGPDGVERPLLAGNILWGGGVVAHPLTRDLGLPMDRAGRIKVTPNLTVPGYPEVFAVGDLASVPTTDDPEGPTVPGVAPAATQMGKYVADLLRRRLTDRPAPKPFEYWDKGSMATIGRSKAVAYPFNRIKMTGFLAWMAWLLIHIVFLIGFRNKVVTLVQWLYQYISFHSGARIIPSADRPRPEELQRMRTYANDQSITAAARQDDSTQLVDPAS